MTPLGLKVALFYIQGKLLMQKSATFMTSGTI